LYRRIRFSQFAVSPSQGEAPSEPRQDVSTSTAFAKPVTQKIVQFGDGVNLVPGRGPVVFNTAKNHILSVDDDVAATGIVIAGLADATYIDHDLLVVQPILAAQVAGRHETTVFRKNAGNVCVALETISLDKGKNPLNLAFVVNVLGENVFTQRTSRRSVNEHQIAITMRSGQLSQKRPSRLVSFGFLFDLGASPENGAFGTTAESFRIE